MLIIWILFIAFVLVMLALDLGVFNREAHVVSSKEATRWVAFFVSLALIFNVCVYFMYANNWMGMGDRYRQIISTADTQRHGGGHGDASSASAGDATTTAADQAKAASSPTPTVDTPTLSSRPDSPLLGDEASGATKTYSNHKLGIRAAGEFFAGWLTEYSLSVDNIFVISLLFTFFSVPPKFQHRVLFWGILGALVFRGVMIGFGAEIVRRWEWVLLIFGAFLLVQGVKLLKPSDQDFDPQQSRLIRLTRKIIPVTDHYEEQKFFTRIDGKRFATPLFLVLLVVEMTDVIFAVDSIPAIFGITRDPFLIFTSNVFAIMGLRSLYFALASLLDKFHYLHYSLAVILAGVGVKMLVENAHHARGVGQWLPASAQDLISWLPDHSIHVPTAVSLGGICGSLVLGMIASLVYARKHPGEGHGAKPAAHPSKDAH